MSIRGQISIQAWLYHLDQVEAGVEGAQVPLPGFLCHRDHIFAAFRWRKTEDREGLKLSWHISALTFPYKHKHWFKMTCHWINGPGLNDLTWPGRRLLSVCTLTGQWAQVSLLTHVSADIRPYWCEGKWKNPSIHTVFLSNLWLQCFTFKGVLNIYQ